MTIPRSVLNAALQRRHPAAMLADHDAEFLYFGEHGARGLRRVGYARLPSGGIALADPQRLRPRRNAGVERELEQELQQALLERFPGQGATLIDFSRTEVQFTFRDDGPDQIQRLRYRRGADGEIKLGDDADEPSSAQLAAMLLEHAEARPDYAVIEAHPWWSGHAVDATGNRGGAYVPPQTLAVLGNAGDFAAVAASPWDEKPQATRAADFASIEEPTWPKT
jgi:hypothetical protein